MITLVIYIAKRVQFNNVETAESNKVGKRTKTGGGVVKTLGEGALRKVVRKVIHGNR